MNDNKQSSMLSYFNEQISACKNQVRSLEQDHRRDEAVFAKVRLNIYDIFRTVFSAAVNSDANTAKFFLAKLDEIPRNWRTSLDLARQHGNVKKAHLEQIKLDTAAEIRKTFETVWEVRQ